MAGLKHRGKIPSTQADIVDEEYVDGLASRSLSQNDVDAVIASGLAPYATKAYVDTRDAFNATAAYVDAGDATRLHRSQINANNGAAGLDSSGKIDAARVDIPSTQPWPAAYYSPASYNASTVNATTETTVYTTTIPDQGHSYLLSMVMGSVDVSTSVEGEYPIVRVRAISATNGPLIAIGQGSSENIPTTYPDVAFDAVGSGYTGHNQNYSFTHNATAGAYVIVDISLYDETTVSTITYDGVAMTSLGVAPNYGNVAYGAVRRYGRANVPGGTKTIIVGLNRAQYSTANSVSYLNVGTVGAAQLASGYAYTASHTVSCEAREMVVHSIGWRLAYPNTALPTGAGGTNRYIGGALDGIYYDASLILSDAGPGTTIFTSTIGAIDMWSGMATVLSSRQTTYAGVVRSTPLVPTGSNVVFSGPTQLFVTLARSGSSATVSAANTFPSLWVAPIQAPPFTAFNEENTNRSNQTTPVGTAGVWVTLQGGGGAGGNGMVSGTNSRAGGGGGGGGGRVNRVFIPSYLLGSSYSCTRGLGGASAAQAGSASSFSTGSITLTANGGGGGQTSTGSNTTGGSGGTASASGISATTASGGNGGAGTVNNSNPGAANANNAGAGGGSGGGNRSSYPTENGGNGGNSSTVTGGAGGVSLTPNGSSPAAAAAPNGGAGGGGGLGRYNSSNIGAGAQGGLYGGGGGGGGSGSVAGQFGRGGDGYLLLEWV